MWGVLSSPLGGVESVDEGSGARDDGMRGAYSATGIGTAREGRAVAAVGGTGSSPIIRAGRGPQGGAPLPSRGQTSPLIVNNIALPSGYPKVVKASTLSRRVAQIFLAPGRPMLRDPKEAAELQKHEKRDQDRALENKDVLF